MPRTQRQRLAALVTARGWSTATEYVLDGVSGYSDDPRYLKVLAQAVEAARRREWDVLLVWSLDRLTRRGVEHLCSVLRRIEAHGARVVSLQESWTEVEGELRELMVAVTAWVARFESTRISERTKAGLARRKSAGLPIGRQPGARDRRRRHAIRGTL